MLGSAFEPRMQCKRPSCGLAEHEPFAIKVIEQSGGRITAVTAFVAGRLFGLFDLPPVLRG
jgi:hypothetical protein